MDEGGEKTCRSHFSSPVVPVHVPQQPFDSLQLHVNFPKIFLSNAGRAVLDRTCAVTGRRLEAERLLRPGNQEIATGGPRNPTAPRLQATNCSLAYCSCHWLDVKLRPGVASANRPYVLSEDRDRNMFSLPSLFYGVSQTVAVG